MEEVEVDSLSDKPTRLWDEVYSKERVSRKIPKPLSADTPISADALRFACISDTHGRLDALVGRIPPADVLVHCGDFTNFGERDEIEKFNRDLDLFPHKHKLVIAGNHEFGFEDDEDASRRLPPYRQRGTPAGYRLLTNCQYLQNSGLNICGVRVYGASWVPLMGYSFSKERGVALLNEWLKIPNVDVLLTHTPPLGHSDIFKDEGRWGCAELLNCVERRIRPQFHVFGHVHEQNGWTTNGVTRFVNASICDHSLKPVGEPHIFDVPLPKDINKKDALNSSYQKIS